MPTLSQSLNQTSHRSVLLRKLRKLGFSEIASLIQLGAQRGCIHYHNTLERRPVIDPGLEQLPNEELVIALLHGGQPYEPMAIRCAAQLLKTPGLDYQQIAFAAIRERCEIPLRYIASMGKRRDPDGETEWEQILESLPGPHAEVQEGVLPHYSRFMSDPGIQRGGRQPATWLNPSP